MKAKAEPQNPNNPAERFTDSYLAYVLARASFLISNEFHEMLARQRIPVMRWRILAVLSDGALSVTELARIAMCKQPMVSRNVDRMAQLGLLRRDVDVTDRRSIRVSLTPKGQQLVRRLHALAKEHEAAVLEPLGVGNARALMAMLKKLIELHAPRR
ncbi:MAG: MarR family transcriptional regulator [Burkholderiaceae bacterium]|nr:MarR family transcriptional regulator [Burkholderiaceae bacterium]